MALLGKKEVSERDITFRKDPVISTGSNWTFYGAYKNSENIVIEDGGRIELNVSAGTNNKAEYGKIIIKLDSDDTTLSTKESHKVCAVLRIHYLDGDVEEIVTDCFYPAYTYETNTASDYAILSLINKPIICIDVKVYNFESVPVILRRIDFYLNMTVYNEVLQEIEERGIIIPLVSSISEIEDKPDGYLVRCEWIEGEDY